MISRDSAPLMVYSLSLLLCTNILPVAYHFGEPCWEKGKIVCEIKPLNGIYYSSTLFLQF